MENCGSADLSTSGDLSSICVSAADPPDPSSGNREKTTLNDINDSLNFEDSQNLSCDLISSHVKDDTISSLGENRSNDRYGTKIGDTTVPSSSKNSAGVDNMEKKNGQTSAASSTLKLVPAIKGSREKLGKPPRNLSVKWAPDVYDPVPTAVSHVPTNKSQRHNSDGKKNGRNKQKGAGKSSRSSSRSKDKKPARKVVGGSSRCYNALDNDFEVESADAFCGSSFLKKSVAQLHFPVAEAT